MGGRVHSATLAVAHLTGMPTNSFAPLLALAAAFVAAAIALAAVSRATLHLVARLRSAGAAGQQTYATVGTNEPSASRAGPHATSCGRRCARELATPTRPSEEPLFEAVAELSTDRLHEHEAAARTIRGREEAADGGGVCEL
jgi:hypothetical protein